MSSSPAAQIANRSSTRSRTAASGTIRNSSESNCWGNPAPASSSTETRPDLPGSNPRRQPSVPRPHEASRSDEPVEQVVLPVPAPREPARDLVLARENGGAHSGNDHLRQPAAVHRLRHDLVPARQLARVPLRLFVDDAAGDDRAAALERYAQPLQLLRLQPELELDVPELRRPGVVEAPQ